MKSKITKYRTRCANILRGKILDLGAGEGSYTSSLRGDLVSIDIDLYNLKNVSGEKIASSALLLPFPDDTFNGVWSCAVLEHLVNNFIPEAIRVTKIGGMIYILTPNRNSPYDPIKRLFGLGDWSQPEGHVRLYSISELERYGKVYGEVWWLPILDQIARFIPFLGHTIMLKICVSSKIKKKFIRRKIV